MLAMVPENDAFHTKVKIHRHRPRTNASLNPGAFVSAHLESGPRFFRSLATFRKSGHCPNRCLNNGVQHRTNRGDGRGQGGHTADESTVVKSYDFW